MTTTPARALRPAALYTLRPGDLAWFRYNGTGQPKLVRVQPRGPLGQFYVCFVLPDGSVDPTLLPCGEGNEMFVDVSG